MAGELEHIGTSGTTDTGARLQKAEYEGTDKHRLDGQTTDDIIVAKSATSLGRLAFAASRILGKGAAGNLAALTAAQVKTILGAGVASGLATLNGATKVIEQPASITDFLENPPTEDLATKAPTSEWAFDHEVTPPFDHLTGLFRSRGHPLIIPTISWTEVENNVTVDQETRFIKLAVADAAPAGDGRAYLKCYGLSGAGANVEKMDWDKELFIQFVTNRFIDEATSPPLCFIR